MLFDPIRGGRSQRAHAADYLAKANNPSPLTLRTAPLVHDNVRDLFGPASGGCALTLRLDPQTVSEGVHQRYLTKQALPQATISTVLYLQKVHRYPGMQA